MHFLIVDTRFGTPVYVFLERVPHSLDGYPGLAVQEAALVVACGAFGIGPVPALALALVLRLRDVVCGLPLLYWPLLEYRHYARSRARG